MLSRKTYVKLIYASPADETSLRDCVATAIKEFAASDEPQYDRQLYFTVRPNAEEFGEFNALTPYPLADVTFDLPRGQRLESMKQADARLVEFRMPDDPIRRKARGESD